MFIVQADWSAEAKTCIVVQASPTTLNATFFFREYIIAPGNQFRFGADTRHGSDRVRLVYFDTDDVGVDVQAHGAYGPVEASLPRRARLFRRDVFC